ncbi:MAG: hypothetical protein IJL37_01850 [Bacteroidaceae bacterium]|nr:hypothetical protein [Bacteroidaceae bacterium]
MVRHVLFYSLRGVFSANLIEAGIVFFKAIIEHLAESKRREEISIVKINKLEERVAIIERRSHIYNIENQQLIRINKTRGRRKDVLLTKRVNEEELLNAIKDYLHGRRIDNDEVDLTKYVIPTPRFAIFLYQILDRKGLIVHGEKPQMRYSAYGRFLQQCTGLNYAPARQNYVRMMNCYNAFCCDGKEIKLYELDLFNIPIGFKQRSDAELLKKQYDYLETQLCLHPFFQKIL